MKLIKLLPVVLAAFLGACNDSPTSSLEPAIPLGMGAGDGIPEEAFTLTEEGFSAKFAKDVPLAKRSGNSVMDFAQFGYIFDKVKERYHVPDFDTIETEEQLQELENLLGLERDIIAKHANQIRANRIAAQRYLLYGDIVDAINSGKVPALPKKAYIAGMNQNEFWLLSMNPTCIDGTIEAVRDAKRFEEAWRGSAGSDNRGDAFRHMIWNHLMADYNSHEFNYKSEAANWAKRFANAHEAGAEANTSFYEYNYPATGTTLSSSMDYHNNEIGRERFLMYSNNRGKLSWWGYDSRWIETMSVDLARFEFQWLAGDVAVHVTSAADMAAYKLWKPVFLVN